MPDTTRSDRKTSAARKPSGGLARAGSFRQFVRKHAKRGADSAFESFQQLARDDSFPDVGSWAEIRSYLVNAGADHEAMVGARMAWREFCSR